MINIYHEVFSKNKTKQNKITEFVRTKLILLITDFIHTYV